MCIRDRTFSFSHASKSHFSCSAKFPMVNVFDPNDNVLASPSLICSYFLYLSINSCFACSQKYIYPLLAITQSQCLISPSVSGDNSRCIWMSWKDKLLKLKSPESKWLWKCVWYPSIYLAIYLSIYLVIFRSIYIYIYVCIYQSNAYSFVRMISCGCNQLISEIIWMLGTWLFTKQLYVGVCSMAFS